MVKGNPVRSETALEADKLQEKLVQRSRVWQIWAAIALLALGVWLAISFKVNELIIMTGVIAWAVFITHVNLTQVLHELYELNDQLAGRKDEFRAIFQREAI